MKNIYISGLILILFCIGTFTINGENNIPLLEKSSYWNNSNEYFSEVPNTYNANQNTCLPRAIAQIIKYWEYPKHGIGSKTYTYNGILHNVDFSNQNYDFNIMPHNLDNFDQSAKEVSEVLKLLYHCGVAVNMKWGGEGASLKSGMHTLKQILRNYFGYSPFMEVISINDFDFEADKYEFKQIIWKEINIGRPVLLNYPGHILIIDGYEGEGLFHIKDNRNEFFYLFDEDSIGGFDKLCFKEDYDILIKIAPDKIASDFILKKVISNSLPYVVEFEDNSLSHNSEIISWKWDFGDGNYSTEKNPVHTYYCPGEYSVSLEVYNGVDYRKIKKNNFIVVKHKYEYIVSNSKVDSIKNNSNLNLVQQNTNENFGNEYLQKDFPPLKIESENEAKSIISNNFILDVNKIWIEILQFYKQQYVFCMNNIVVLMKLALMCILGFFFVFMIISLFIEIKRYYKERKYGNNNIVYMY